MLGDELDAVSELLLLNAGLPVHRFAPSQWGKSFPCVPSPSLWPRSDSCELGYTLPLRSEERRVGKECRL